MEADQFLAVTAGILGGVACLPAYEFGTRAASLLKLGRGEGEAAVLVQAIAGMVALGIAIVVPIVMLGVYPLRAFGPYWGWAFAAGALGLVVVVRLWRYVRALLAKREGDV